MKEIITNILAIAFAAISVIALIAAISLIGSTILWLIYTHVVATTFGLPQIALWKFWLISIFVSAVGRKLFGRTSVNVEKK